MREESDGRTRLHVPGYVVAPVLLLLVGGILAMVLTASTSSATGLILVPGSDGQCQNPPIYPCETVSIDGTGTVATIGISFPRSNVSTPQPAAYYTDLVEIHNVGSVPHTVASLNVTNVTGAAYLGKITVYYCAVATEDPTSSPNCADFSIVGASGGYLSGNNVLPSTLNPGKAGYIEVVAFASSASSPSDMVSFVLEMSASLPSTTTQQGGGGAPPASSTSSSTTSTSTSTTTEPTAPTVTVTITATKTATSTSITVSTSLATSVSTSTTTETVESTTTSTATHTSTATKVSTTTETTETTTTASPPVSPGLPLWILLLVILALIALVVVLVRRWLKERASKGARFFWQT